MAVRNKDMRRGIGGKGVEERREKPKNEGSGENGKGCQKHKTRRRHEYPRGQLKKKR